MTREPSVDELGRVAYTAYRELTGNLLVPWEQQTPQMREVWRGTADAVRMWLQLHEHRSDEWHTVNQRNWEA